MLEFRRALFCIFNALWDYMGKPVMPLNYAVASELMHAMCSLALAVTNMRAKVSPRVTCSDASETGGVRAPALGLHLQHVPLLPPQPHRRSGN